MSYLCDFKILLSNKKKLTFVTIAYSYQLLNLCISIHLVWFEDSFMIVNCYSACQPPLGR